jgi:hypothetical protein
MVALGVCAMFASVTVPTMFDAFGGWPLLGAGTLTVVAGLLALWNRLRRQDLGRS